MLSRLRYYTTLFLFGFFGYGFLEILWRGYTHPTMGLAGGLSVLFISFVSRSLKSLNIVYRAILCGLFITCVEFIIGYIMNIRLHAGIWDYSQMPLNLLGQVCFSFSVLWCFISLPIMTLCEKFYLSAVESCR